MQFSNKICEIAEIDTLNKYLKFQFLPDSKVCSRDISAMLSSGYFIENALVHMVHYLYTYPLCAIKRIKLINENNTIGIIQIACDKSFI